MRFLDIHPSDEELVLAADGELSARHADRLRKHLAGCWECRVRAQKLEGAIQDFVHLYRRNLDLLLPPASGRRALLRIQLDERASSISAPWQQLLTWPKRSIPIAASILALVLIGLIVPPHRQLRRQAMIHASFVAMSFPATKLTPGVARFKTKDQVCSSNKGNNREVPAALRRKVFALYGIPGADPKSYEVDYLITPALGGADDIRNLWPQSYSATMWNAHVKDALEDRLHELVCRGDVDLSTAQREIAIDWIGAYKKYFHTNQPINSPSSAHSN